MKSIDGNNEIVSINMKLEMESYPLQPPILYFFTLVAVSRQLSFT